MEQLFSPELLRNIIVLAHDIFGSVAHAASTVPTAITLPRFTSGQNFGELINNIYDVAIALVGLAVLVQFTIAGLIYMLAAGNAAEVSSATKKMQNAGLGAILLLSAYLILNVINPDLTRTDLFNLEQIKQQIKGTQPSIGPGTPRGGDYPTEF